jgi:CCR4-NOT transcription complex subunit 6
MSPQDAEGKPRLERVEFLYTRTPVEDCDLIPYVVITNAAGEVRSAEAIEAKTRGSLSVQYRWNRCAARYSCAQRSCMKPATVQFVPLLKIAGERLLTEEQVQTVVRESFFCSQKCLKAGWPVLKDLQETYYANCPRKPEYALGSGCGGGESGGGGGGGGVAANGHGNGHMSEQDGEAGGLPPQPDDAAIDAALATTVARRSDGVFAEPLQNPLETSEVGFVRSFAPSSDDVGHVLQLVCRYVHRLPDGKIDIGPPLSVESEPVRRLPAAQIDRRMMSLATGEMFPCKDRRPGTFRVLTYNVLSEIYTNSQAYPYCPKWGLAWTYRRLNLLREITQYDADIMCLQECQADHFDEHFMPYFSRMGYNGVFKAKTRESMGRRGKIDGCATFYRKSMFVMRESTTVEYNAIAHSRTQAQRTLNRCLKGNVGLILVLDAVDGSGPIMVANTHLFWDPELTDVKLFQVDAFLQELEMQAQRLGAEVPIIVGGDFNSEPGSSVYELMSTGTCGSRDDIGDDTFGVLNTCRLQHGIHLRSSYSLSGSEPKYTNYTHSFVGTLDYIWYTPETIVATALMEVPDKRQLFENAQDSDGVEGIPNMHWSSDHIALCTGELYYISLCSVLVLFCAPCPIASLTPVCVVLYLSLLFCLRFQHTQPVTTR